MKYVDGFVFVVPKKKVGEYKKMATEGANVWKKFGALEYYECIGDDLHPDMHGMKTQNFPKLIKLKKNETVWFSFIIYNSRKHRDSVNKKVMSYFNKKYKDKEHSDMPFDMRRFSYGGFKAMVEK